MSMTTTAGMLRDGAQELHYYQGLHVLKTSKPHKKKKINFCMLFLWANMALCPSCGSRPHSGRGVMEEQ